VNGKKAKQLRKKAVGQEETVYKIEKITGKFGVQEQVKLHPKCKRYNYQVSKYENTIHERSSS
jgi:hypothetical protein